MEHKYRRVNKELFTKNEANFHYFAPQTWQLIHSVQNSIKISLKNTSLDKKSSCMRR